jgi:uncharacterized protein YggU (UPF0235/DUF167 family)
VRAFEPIERSAQGITCSVRLMPRGGRDAVDGWKRAANGSGHLKVRVCAVPENGRANAALIVLVAEKLHVAKSSVSIAGGHTSRLKRIEVAGDGPALSAELTAWGKAQ